MRFKHRLQRWMRIGDSLLLLPPPHVGVHHLAHDRTGPNDGHLHHQIVEALRMIARQRRHLRAALHLKHAHRVGLLQRAIDLLVLGQVRQIDRLAVVRGNQFKAILEHGHHAQAEQVHLDDAQVGAVFLVPLDDRAAGHGSALQRHHVIQLPLADHHAARVLAEMARQVLNAHAELKILGDARMLNVEARVLKRVRHGVVFAAPLPMADEAGEAAERVLIEAQRLAHFARRRLAAIGDDVGGHGRAQFAVALVDILNGLLALRLRRQIEIDVRPLVAALAQETLEEQLHADRIDGRNFKRVADGGVGGAAAALHQNAVLLAELNDVPDDEEVAGKAQLRDQRQLVLHLLFCALQQVTIFRTRSVGSRPRRCACAESCPWFRRRARDSAETRSQDRSAAKPRRDESSTVFSMASGTSRNSAAISRAGRRKRSIVYAPAAARPDRVGM